MKEQKTKEQLLDEARTFGVIGRYEEALVACDQAMLLDPNFAMAYAFQSSALCGLGRHKEALEACKQAIRLDPNNDMAYFNKAISLDKLCGPEEALEVYDHTICLNPNFVMAYYRKALALGVIGRYEEALKFCEQAIRLDPNFGSAYDLKGAMLMGLKLYNEASIAFEQARSLGSRESKYLSNLAQEMSRIRNPRRMGLAIIALFALALILFLILTLLRVSNDVLYAICAIPVILGEVLFLPLWLWVSNLAVRRGEIGWAIFLFFLSVIAVPLYLIINPFPRIGLIPTSRP